MDFREQDVHHMVSNVMLEFARRSPRRQNAAFYWAVQGGNVKLAQSVLASVRQRHMNDELKWLLNMQNSKRSSWASTVVRILCIPLKSLLLVVTFVMALTPLFRIYHMLVSRLTACKITPDSDLPLFLAALSGKRNMVELFLQNGVTLLQTDDQDRNIFHVLVDSSLTDASAVPMYNIIIQVYRNSQDLKHAMLKQMDRDGLTAMETCAKRGSPRLLNEFLNTENFLRKTTVTIVPGCLSLAQDHSTLRTTAWNESYGHKLPEEGMWCSEMLETQNSGQETESDLEIDSAQTYQRFHYDVTEYEQGGLLGKQSLPLLLLATHRSLGKYGADDVKHLWECPVVHCWGALKRTAGYPCLVVDLIVRMIIYLGVAWFGFSLYDELIALPLANLFIDETDNSYKQRLLKATNPAATYTEVCEQNFILFAGIPLDECQFEAVEKVQLNCPDDNLTAWAVAQEGSEISDMWTFGIPSNAVIHASLGLAVFFVLYSTLAKLVFLIHAAKCTGSLQKGARRIFAINMPGSSLDEFLLLVLCLTHFTLHGLLWRVTETKELGIRLEWLLLWTNVAYYVHMVVSFLSTLSTLRLMPAFGYYVLVTKKLMVVLLHFMVMCGAIMIALAVVLQYAMHLSECSLLTHPKFTTFSGSLYQTYKLTFHAGAFVYDLNTNTKLLYVFYSMSGILLLLNLIIAVMSAKAGQLMSNPWKTYIWWQEYLSHYLYLEVGLNSILWVFRARGQMLRYLGYRVENKGREFKVYIEVEKKVKIEDTVVESEGITRF